MIRLSLVLLIGIYLLSMYPLVRMFIKMIYLIHANPGNGLQFYRKMVTISIAISAIDATYTILIILANVYIPQLADDLLIGLIPVVLKGAIMMIVWVFYVIQQGNLDCPIFAFWKKILHIK